MNAKIKIKVLIDITMTGLLFAVMAYHKTGESLHKWLGIGMIALFLLHHILNKNWYKGLMNGRCTPVRQYQIIINILLIGDMLALMLSGFLLSSLALRLHIPAGLFARKLHMISASWCYILVSAHIGFHWKIVAGKWYRTSKNRLIVRLSRLLMIAVTAYGIYTAVTRQFFLKMFWQLDYAFYDYEEAIIIFIFDYMCVLIGIAYVSYCVVKVLSKTKG